MPRWLLKVKCKQISIISINIQLAYFSLITYLYFIEGHLWLEMSENPTLYHTVRTNDAFCIVTDRNYHKQTFWMPWMDANLFANNCTQSKLVMMECESNSKSDAVMQEKT